MRVVKFWMLLAIWLLASHTMNAQQDMELTKRQQALVAIAANEAKGNLEGLKQALNEGFENGLTISEAKEALSQLYAYTGFPRSLNALGALQQVIKEREAEGKRTEAGREDDQLPKDYDALKQGTAVQTRLSGQPFNYAFAPQTDYYLKAHLFGDIFARNNLTFADREIVTVSAISALAGCEPQLKAHVSGARNMGVSDGQLHNIPGVLRARVGYGQFFIGNSYLADMGNGLFNVTFEPGCRNNWHVHHHQVQVLICVAGRGWYQEWGKPAVEMTPGTVIHIPAEAKHWHGAARDSWFQHLTYHTNIEEGASNEWLEPVTDEVYNQVK